MAEINIPETITLDEALELVKVLSVDGRLTEEIYNALLRALPSDLHEKFSLAMATDGIIVAPPMESSSEDVREARRIVLGKIEDQGFLDEQTYRDLLARFGPGTGIHLNQWMFSAGIGVGNKEYEQRLKQDLKRRPLKKKIPIRRVPKI
jgi:hypothetical protein